MAFERAFKTPSFAIILIVLFGGCSPTVSDRLKQPEQPRNKTFESKTAVNTKLIEENRLLKENIGRLEIEIKETEELTKNRLLHMEKTIELMELNIAQLKGEWQKKQTLSVTSPNHKTKSEKKEVIPEKKAVKKKPTVTSDRIATDLKTPDTSKAIEAVSLLPALGKQKNPNPRRLQDPTLSRYRT